MLKELRRYNNLGTPEFFFRLLHLIYNNESQVWTIHDLKAFFHNKIIDNRYIFDGCFEIALHINFLIIQNNNIYINDRFKPLSINQKQLIDKFNELLFLSLKDDEDIYNVFSSENLSYDIIYKSIQLNNNAFGFKFSNIKQLFLDFGIIYPHPTIEVCYILNNRYKKLFDKLLLPEIKKRRIGIEEFNKKINQQQINGEEAERFVLNFEEKRLNQQCKVDWIAEYVVNAGYDIASFNNCTDIEYNRFIEVKSYSGLSPYFYWSKNEFQVARIRKDNYWIYLVNRDKINDKNYIPEMIQNPYREIIEMEHWNKEVDKFKISAIK